MTNDMEVFLVVFDKTAFEISQDLLGEVNAFITENYVELSEQKYSYLRRLSEETVEIADIQYDVDKSESNLFQSEDITEEFLEPEAALREPETVFQQAPKNLSVKLDEPFSITLLKIIDAKGKTDVEIYKRANIDRKLFSKIRTAKGYMPSKKTVVALAIALELSLSETRDLLERAGFALSRSVMFDVIIEYFITRQKYDIFEINNVLFEYDQSLLGG
jgi:hypothetical protein